MGVCADDIYRAPTASATSALAFGFGDREFKPLDGHRLFQRAGQFLFNRRPETAQLVHPPGLDGASQIVERAHFELVIEQLDPLRSEAGKRGHVAKLAGKYFFQLFQQLEMPSFDDVGNLAGQVLADPRQFREILFRRQQVPDALRQAFDGAGGPVIGAHAKLVLAFDFEQVGGLIEHRHDFGILNRHRHEPSKRRSSRATIVIVHSVDWGGAP